MIASNANANPDRAADGSLAELIEELSAKIDSGEPVDLPAYLEAHPEHAEELHRLLPALQLLADLSRSGSASVPPVVSDGPDYAGALGDLGDFRILREVGRGGMGIVYEAEQVSLGRRVALKVLPLAGAMDPRHLQRFNIEAQAAAQLHHMSIVPVHYVGCERGVHFYAMQFIEGQSLADLIAALRGRASGVASAPRAESPEKTTAYAPADGAPESPPALGALTRPRSPETAPVAAFSTIRSTTAAAYFRTVAELGIQAAEALDFAHQHGIVHRDVKPANLLVDAESRLWVTDFGLAQVQGDARMTMTGDLVGTLRYMSPEQALAKRVDVDHRTDIYSLGATLYELLTLEPAFTGADRQELLRQIAFEEPRPPRRLKRPIPAELETIVLKALEKNPTDRYGTAKEVAEDLRRFLEDEPIRARRPTWAQVARKWARRHRPLVASMLAALVMGLAVLAGSFGWVARDQAARKAQTTQVVNAALEEADSWQQQRRLPEALSAARRARAMLAFAEAADDLQRHVRARLANLELLDRLENIRLDAVSVKDGHFDWERADALYRRNFENAGLDILGLSAEEAGERIRATSVAGELAAVLDDWVGSHRKTVGKNGLGWKHLLQVARAADPDPWRSRVREAIEREDWKALRSLAVSDEVFRLPPASLDVVGANLLVDAEKDRAIEAFLREAQRRHPNDFWLNHNLVTFYLNRQPSRSAEALPFAWVAVALRPDSSAAHSRLGIVLQRIGKLGEAIAEGAEAVRLNPHDALAHIGLSVFFAEKGRVDEAIAECNEAINLNECLSLAYNNLALAFQKMGESGREKAIAAYRKAIELDKNFAEPHYNLGNLFKQLGRLDEAILEYGEALQVKRDYPQAHTNLGNILRDKRRLDEAIAEYLAAIASMFDFPEAYIAHHGLGVALADKQDLDGAITSYGEAIRLKGDFALAHSCLGEALRRKGRLDEAETACRKAIEIDPHLAGAHYNLGLILQNQRRLPEAEAAYRKAIELNPGFAEAHFNLGHTLREQGRFADALEALKKGHEFGSPWGYPSAQWVRETERLVELDAKLPKVLKGELQPADIGERLALADMCLEYKALYMTAFRLYSDAFAEQPDLARDLQNHPRYNAARAAAMAGCGQGKDADKLDKNECTGLRKQALDWLRADLAAWRHLLDIEPNRARAVVLQTMERWQQYKELAGVRDSAALTKLLEAERQEWQKLWAEVNQLRQEATKPTK
jgi:serine/threonine protein kinase/Flp pilus assembly protein TadD